MEDASLWITENMNVSVSLVMPDRNARHSILVPVSHVYTVEHVSTQQTRSIYVHVNQASMAHSVSNSMHVRVTHAVKEPVCL